MQHNHRFNQKDYLIQKPPYKRRDGGGIINPSTVDLTREEVAQYREGMRRHQQGYNRDRTVKYDHDINVNNVNRMYEKQA